MKLKKIANGSVLDAKENAKKFILSSYSDILNKVPDNALVLEIGQIDVAGKQTKESDRRFLKFGGSADDGGVYSILSLLGR